MEVVVWDFRAIGGPLYCGYAWSTMCYGDCVREAARRAVGDWHAFAFGHSYPIPYGAQFLATAGGVIQFRPPGETPVWYGTLLSRLNTVVAWAREAELPSHSSDRPVCVLHHDSTTVTLFSGSRFPGAGARETIADLVGRQPTTALFVTPTGSGCARLCVGGVPSDTDAGPTWQADFPGSTPGQSASCALVLGGWSADAPGPYPISWASAASSLSCLLYAGA